MAGWLISLLHMTLPVMRKHTGRIVLLVVEMAVGVAAVAFAFASVYAFATGFTNPLMKCPADVLKVNKQAGGRTWWPTQADADLLRRCPDLAGAALFSTYALDDKEYRSSGKSTTGLKVAFGSPPSGMKNLVVVEGDTSLLDVVALRIASGSFFNQEDIKTGRKVCLLNPAAARTFFGNQRYLGRTISYSGENYRVIGIVREVRHWPSDNWGLISVPEPWPMLFLPPRIIRFDAPIQAPASLWARVKQGRSLQAAAREIEDILGAKYPGMKIDAFSPKARFLNQPYGKYEMLRAFTLGGFGILILLVAALGITGFVMLSVMQRRREIGIRMALGAAPGKITASLLAEACLVAASGSIAGLPIAYGAAYLFRATKYLEPDLMFKTAVFAVCFAIGVGLASALYPALRAARIKPAEALRD